MPPVPRITLLDGLPPGGTAEAIAAQLADAGELTSHALASTRFAPCQGCWHCWVEQPGSCKVSDASNPVMRDAIGADVVFWATELRFGCWSATTKAAMDKCLGLISPFFLEIDGETHHRRRYPHYPRWAVLAAVDADVSADERRLFERLVARNALNMHGGTPWVGFVDADASATTVRTTVQSGLSFLSQPSPRRPAELAPFAVRPHAVGVPPRADGPRHAVLWVGSAKPAGKSTSESIGSALLQRLEQRGWTGEVVPVASSVKLGREGAPRLLEAFRRADLVILSSPVYVDCLPALVLAGLDRLAQADLGPRPPALLPLVQCGFPELQHNALALEVASKAASRIGLSWAGHLAMAGGAMIDGSPLADLGGRVRHQTLALDRAAMELDSGHPVSAETTEAFATAALPPWLYRMSGQASWITQAIQHGSMFKLWDRPFESR